MPVILPNALISTARAVYTASSGQTSEPVAYLAAVPAYLAPVRATQLATLPENALSQVTYCARVESGTDIVANDLVTLITLADGLTPWPSPFPASAVCVVKYAQESAPGILAERVLYLAFILTGGPAF